MRFSSTRLASDPSTDFGAFKNRDLMQRCGFLSVVKVKMKFAPG